MDRHCENVMCELSLSSLYVPTSPLCSVCCTGDGGNDVSMIQESDCGVGVEGKVSVGASTLPP